MDKAAYRIDLWLWRARFFKSRTLAAKILRAGKVRMDHNMITKPSCAVRIGAVLTFPQKHNIRVVKILKIEKKRVSAERAATLYQDLMIAQNL